MKKISAQLAFENWEEDSEYMTEGSVQVLWRVLIWNKAKSLNGQKIRCSNWFLSESEARQYIKKMTEEDDSELISISCYELMGKNNGKYREKT